MEVYHRHYNIAKLILKYLRTELSEKERKVLDEWLLERPENKTLFDQITTESHLKTDLQEFFGIDHYSAKIRFAHLLKERSKSKVISFWRKYAAVAAVFLITLLGFLSYQGYLWLKTEKSEALVQDIPPAKNTATLILSNGETIILDDIKNGKIVEEAGLKVYKSAAGEIVYQLADQDKPLSEKNLHNTFHTLHTGRGEKTKIVLSDNTEVWLNAASTLRFPTKFPKGSREVFLDGEAYFEVSKNADQSFWVKSKGQSVRVLGTHFNINSYDDESEIVTTLFEGSVQVNHPAGFSKILKPGQRAVLNSKQIEVVNADLSTDLAWKESYFIFRNETLGSIMRKVSKWYNIDVEYEDDVANQSFYGSISRNKSLNFVLKALEISGNVKFKLEGRRVKVMKK